MEFNMQSQWSLFYWVDSGILLDPRVYWQDELFLHFYFLPTEKKSQGLGCMYNQRKKDQWKVGYLDEVNEFMSFFYNSWQLCNWQNAKDTPA